MTNFKVVLMVVVAVVFLGATLQAETKPTKAEADAKIAKLKAAIAAKNAAKKPVAKPAPQQLVAPKKEATQEVVVVKKNLSKIIVVNKNSKVTKFFVNDQPAVWLVPESLKPVIVESKDKDGKVIKVIEMVKVPAHYEDELGGGQRIAINYDGPSGGFLKIMRMDGSSEIFKFPQDSGRESWVN